jgi:UDP-N-acetylglucosamine 3-dehydrogenase
MIKVAVIGVGSMGKNHARVYSELAEAKLVAVCDSDELAAKEVAERGRARVYFDYRKLLEEEKPQAVSIAVPTALHAEVTLAALEAGADVLIEKPIAATLEDGRVIIERARMLGRKLMVGHIVRFNPAVQELKRRMDAGELGRIFQIICRRTGPFPVRIQDVGVAIDLAPHDLDLMRYLTGSDPVRLFAESAQRVHSLHEDLVIGILSFPFNIIGALEINWLTPTVVRETLVLGEHGMFQVDDLTQSLYFYENGQAIGSLWSPLQALRGVTIGPMIRFALKRYEPLKAEIESFLNAIQENTPMPVSGEDGLAALRLAIALKKSSEEHRIIQFEPAVG